MQCKSNLLDSTLWSNLDKLRLILEPIDRAIKLSEADGSHLGEVPGRWRRIKKEWRILFDSDGYPELEQLIAPSGVWQKRYQTQTLDIHEVAYSLDPANQGMTIKPAMQARITGFLKKYAGDNERAFLTMEEAYFGFTNREGVFSVGGEIWQAKPRTFWQHFRSSSPLLAGLAVRVFSTPATSVPSERSFSTMGYIVNKQRNKVGTSKMDKSVYIYMNSRALRRQKAAAQAAMERQPPREPITLAELPDSEQIELEDALLGTVGSIEISK